MQSSGHTSSGLRASWLGHPRSATRGSHEDPPQNRDRCRTDPGGPAHRGICLALPRRLPTGASGRFPDGDDRQSARQALQVAIWYPTDSRPGLHFTQAGVQIVAAKGSVAGRGLPLIVISHRGGEPDGMDRLYLSDAEVTGNNEASVILERRHPSLITQFQPVCRAFRASAAVCRARNPGSGANAARRSKRPRDSSSGDTEDPADQAEQMKLCPNV